MLFTILFWLLLILLFHSYIGYSGFMLLLKQLQKNSNKTKQVQNSNTLTIVIPAYNEALMLKNKIENTLALQHDTIQLQIIVVTDGSTDNSTEIVKQFPQVILLHQAQRNGKAAAINRAMQLVNTSLVLVTDANTILNENAIENILPHFNNQLVGAVSGERFINADGTIGETESLYWRYESFMKKTESEVHSVIAGAGELFCFRTQLFKPLENDFIIDDFMLSVSILKQGYRIVYEENAIASEAPSKSLKEEANRKIRLGAGAAQAMLTLGFKPYKNVLLNFQYYSRRVIRWVIGPLAIPLLLWINNHLLSTHLNIYYYFFYLQIVFYSIAALGAMLHSLKIKSGILSIPFYFVFMNVCLFIGLVKYCIAGQSVNWKKANR